MDFELHAPSMLVVVTSLVAVLALICYFVATPGNVHVPFWLAILAYLVGAFGTTLRSAST